MSKLLDIQEQLVKVNTDLMILEISKDRLYDSELQNILGMSIKILSKQISEITNLIVNRTGE